MTLPKTISYNWQRVRTGGCSLQSTAFSSTSSSPGMQPGSETYRGGLSNHQGALSLESEIKPAVTQLDNRLRRFALRLASLPRGDQARKPVGSSDSALGQRLQSALGCWNGREESGPPRGGLPPGRVHHGRGRSCCCARSEPARPARPNHFHGRIPPREWSDWLCSHMEEGQVLKRPQNPHVLGPGSLRRRMRRPGKSPTGGGHQKPHGRIGHYLHGRASGHPENDLRRAGTGAEISPRSQETNRLPPHKGTKRTNRDPMVPKPPGYRG